MANHVEQKSLPAQPPPPNDQNPHSKRTDGRRLRTEESRKRIVGAVIELVLAGNLSPSAEQVAAAARVGLRSVFRHFNDMESLYREVSVLIEPRLYAVAQQPFVATDWQGQVLELIGRRSVAFETLWHVLRASQLHSFQSQAVRDDHSRLNAALRALFLARLPGGALKSISIEAIDMLLSFETWARLRCNQNLSVEQAKDVLSHAVTAIIERDTGKPVVPGA